MDIARGTLITEEMLHMLSPGSGYKWSELNEVVGKTAQIDISKNEIIESSQLGN